MKPLKKDFPLLQNTLIEGNPICYLDNASTSQKPQSVIDAITTYYTQHNSNIGRGIYRLAEQSTQMFESARTKIAQFVGAQSHEIIFTSNATHGINHVAQMLRSSLNKGDEVVLSELEHHANLLPWQQLAKETGAVLKFIPVTADGMLDMAAVPSLISKRTKLLAVTQSSNALGTSVDVQFLTKTARAVGAYVLIDACQSVPHERIDVKKMDADFLVFSGHKMLGPTGVGVLYIHERLHDTLEPFAHGGGMVFEADWFDATWLKAPQKFQAGTPPIAQVIGLATAIDYLQKNVSFDDLKKHEAALCTRLIDGLSAIKKIRVLGPIDQLKKQGHLVSFVVEGMHPHDVAAYLDTFGICVRAGHFCAQPLAKKLGYGAGIRASFYLYNTIEDVDRLVGALERMKVA